MLAVAPIFATAPSVLGLGGLVVGIVVGLTGMGGGALLTPLLVVGLGLPAGVAVSSDLVVSLLMKPVGAFTHHRRGGVRKDIVRWLATGSVPAAFLGAAAMNLVLAPRAGKSVEPIIGTSLLVAAVFIVVRLVHTRKAGGARTNDAPALRRNTTLAIGILGGFIVGMTSVGSGSLMLVLLAWCYPTLTGTTLVGTDLTQAVPLVAAAAAGHVIFGNPRLGLIIPLVIGALPGTWLGARLAHRVPERLLKPIIVFVLTASGLKLLRVI